MHKQLLQHLRKSAIMKQRNIITKVPKNGSKVIIRGLFITYVIVNKNRGDNKYSDRVNTE